ncbi:MAG: hypothetical protein LBQ97_07465 [Fusobacteriaceae bacterium]|nr:hypothetical protein [Fusobacteriaceae bacterium]
MKTTFMKGILFGDAPWDEDEDQERIKGRDGKKPPRRFDDAFGDGSRVYVVPTDRIYHCDPQCPRLAGSPVVFPLDAEIAEESYRPCPLCCDDMYEYYWTLVETGDAANIDEAKNLIDTEAVDLSAIVYLLSGEAETYGEALERYKKECKSKEE